MKKKTIFVLIGLVMMVAGALWLIAIQAQKPGKLDTFAVCLAEKGAKFYGAFWCPHCQNQKALFGKSQKLLPYIECSTADGRGQLQVCTDAKITGYPTWTFADGSQTGGEMSLKSLAEKTGCVLPQ